MSTSTKGRQANSTQRKPFEHKEGNGSLFYDAPGVPTLTGAFSWKGNRDVTGEPALDKNQREYVRITGADVSGGLFPNDRKEKDTHPDFTGPIEIAGQKLRVSAWKKQIKTGQSAGSEFLSISVSEARQRPEGE